MEVQSVLCNNCGASLEIDETTRFLNCGYCNSQLTVKRSESAVRTEVLDEIRESTRQMAGDLKIIQLQNRLEQLDRDWMQNRERFATRTRHGDVSYPDDKSSSGKSGLKIGIVFGVLVLVGVSFVQYLQKRSTLVRMPDVFGVENIPPYHAVSPISGVPFVAMAIMVVIVLCFFFGKGSLRSRQKTFWSEKEEYEHRRKEIETQMRAMER